jgi:hypothetical protein
MVAKEKGDLFGIKGSNKKGKLQQSTFVAWSFWKITLIEMELKACVTSTCNTTQLRWMYKKIQMPWTTALHPPLTTTPNWWTCNTTQSKWMFKKIQVPWTTALHPPLDYYAKLMRQQMNEKHIMKLQS